MLPFQFMALYFEPILMLLLCRERDEDTIARRLKESGL